MDISGLAPYSYAGRQFWTISEQNKGTKTSLVSEGKKDAIKLIDSGFGSFSYFVDNISVVRRQKEQLWHSNLYL